VPVNTKINVISIKLFFSLHFMSSRIEPPRCALNVLENKLLFCLVSLTDDEKDAKLGAVERVSMPLSSQVSDTSNQESNKKALAFSHICTSPEQLLQHGCTFNAELRPRADVCGVLFDKRTVDELVKGDAYFDVDTASGNVCRVFVMPTGWNKAREANELCHGCGSFPANIACTRCSLARFCSNVCYLRSKANSSHSLAVCTELIRSKVAMSFVDQYAYSSSLLDATSNEDTKPSE